MSSFTGILHEVLILDTMDMVEEFEIAFGYELCAEDRLELFKQLFWILNEHSPLDLDNRNILVYDSFIFANNLNVDHLAVDKIAYHLMVQLWALCRERGLYGGNGLDYRPYSMQGWHLCVRRYKS